MYPFISCCDGSCMNINVSSSMCISVYVRFIFLRFACFSSHPSDSRSGSYLYVYSFVYIYMDICVRVYTYTYIHTYIHGHAHQGIPMASTSPPLIDVSILKDEESRRQHQASCVRAMLRAFALVEYQKAVQTTRAEPLGVDRSRRCVTSVARVHA